MSLLDHIYIVLVATTHPGNIGAAARAMKNMGLSHLRLVQPKHFPCAEATERASGADDVLAQAQIFDSLAASIQDCHLVMGTSARSRRIAWPLLTPKACAEKVLQTQGKVALLFGREHAGLTNEELDQCHYMIQIPTNPQFSSLNVAAAVQVFTYELYSQSLMLRAFQPEKTLLEHSMVSQAQMAQFYEHLEQTLIEISFFNPEKPKLLKRRLQRLFNRAQLEQAEMNILRGILTTVQQKCHSSKQK